MANRWESARQRAEYLRGDAQLKWSKARVDHSSVGFAEAIYERDQDSFASVLGSAIALRLFLFVVPVTLAGVGLVNLMALDHLLDDTVTSNVTLGTLSAALKDASAWKAFTTTVTGLILTLWAGRTLARVLATTSSAAWQLERRSKVRPVQMLALIGVMFSTVVANLMYTRLRDVSGIAAGFVVTLMVLATVTIAWFLVSLTLPRITTDPGAVLPGALMFGVAYTALQWFMQFYLPNKIARTSDTFGQLAVTIATLGNFFFIGRMMSASFVLSAVVFERYGSVSHVIFGLPVVRTLPRKFPKLRTYFALDAQVPAADVEGAAE
ncbi:MAG: hypothetical protein HY828_05980 [Actinobacteria bacterium]|nr:hypothetical protein [Actinomycetota bacterium]